MVAGAITVVQMLPELAGGGVERGTLELGNFLSQSGHDSIVISAGGRLVEQLLRGGSTHISWKIGEKSPRCLNYILPLRRLLLAEKVDVLHLRSRLPAWIGYLAWKSLPAARRPLLITTFHGLYSVNSYSAIMTKGEKVIAISRAVAEHIKEHYGIADEKIALIYRGFDENAFSPSAVADNRVRHLRETWALSAAAVPVIMLPGRMSKWKGHELFLDSLARIKNLNWTAVCVGDPEENPGYARELVSLAEKHGISDRVNFVGHCHDMPAALLLADIVVSASSLEAEAFGRIAVEAQAMARPVVATAHGGSLEIIADRESGWLVKPGDAESMAAALREALADPELRRRYGGNGQRLVREKFTTRQMCEKTVNLYHSLLAEKAGSR